MGCRANDGDVRALKPSDTIDDYQPFISAASVIVDDLAASCGQSFTDRKLKQIEIYLAAHMVSVSDPNLRREKFENAENVFERGAASGVGVLSTQFGQTANMLSGGCLASLDKEQATIDFL